MSEDKGRQVSPLRLRMIEEMTMRRLGTRTQAGYIRGVRRFVQFLGRSPETATVEDVRKFQLHLAQTGTSPQTTNVTLTAVKFLFEQTLDRPDLVSKIRRVREEHKLPVVLSRDEVTRRVGRSATRYRTTPSDDGLSPVRFLPCRLKGVTAFPLQLQFNNFRDIALLVRQSAIWLSPRFQQLSTRASSR